MIKFGVDVNLFDVSKILLIIVCCGGYWLVVCRLVEVRVDVNFSDGC